MARVWTTGFELGNPANDLTTFNGSTITTGLVNGLFAARLTGVYSYYWTKTITAISELFFAGHFRLSSNDQTFTPKVFQWGNGGSALGSIRTVGATSLWQAYVGDTLVAASVAPNTCSINTWYRLDVRVKIADAPNGRIQLWVDDTLVIDYTGDTQPGAATTVDWTGSTTAFYQQYDWDNLALNDTSGAVDNGRIGEERIIALMPNAAGTYAQWVPLAGANYAAVDEQPSDDNTTHVATATNAQKDSYNLGACALSNVVITRAWVEMTALRGAGAGTNQVKPILISGATENLGAALSPGTAYGRLIGVDHTTDPNTAAAWTTAALDAAQAGVQSVV